MDSIKSQSSSLAGVVSSRAFKMKYNPKTVAPKSQDKNGHRRVFKTFVSMMAYLNKPIRKKK